MGQEIQLRESLLLAPSPLILSNRLVLTVNNGLCCARTSPGNILSQMVIVLPEL